MAAAAAAGPAASEASKSAAAIAESARKTPTGTYVVIGGVVIGLGVIGYLAFQQIMKPLQGVTDAVTDAAETATQEAKEWSDQGQTQQQQTFDFWAGGIDETWTAWKDLWGL
jgi:hypothetical protein